MTILATVLHVIHMLRNEAHQLHAFSKVQTNPSLTGKTGRIAGCRHRRAQAGFVFTKKYIGQKQSQIHVCSHSYDTCTRMHDTRRLLNIMNRLEFHSM